MTMHATVRFRSDLPATHMVHILHQGERFGAVVHWDELATVEEDGGLWPEVGVEWDCPTEMVGTWFGSMGIACVYMEEEA